MNRLLQLQQDRAALIDAAGVILKKAETEKRSLNTEECAAFATTELAIEGINSTLAIEQRMAALSNVHSDAPQQRGGTRIDVHDNTLDRPFGPEQRSGESNKEREQRVALGFGEQLQAVRQAAVTPHRYDGRLDELQRRAPSGLSEQVPADGGFLIQPDVSTEIMRIAHEVGLVSPLARKLPLSEATNAIKIPGIDEQSRANGSRWGGITMNWQNEADAATASKPKFRLIELVTKKLLGAMYATDELLADARALGSIATQGFGEETAFKLDDGVIRGTGSGQMLGILNAPALVTIAKESGQANTTIVYQNVLKMWLRMWARSRMNAVWFINQDTEAQLYQMSLAVGTAGAPVFLPPGGASDTPYSRLFGRPVIPIEQCDTLGNLGDIILADISQYVTVDKGDMQSAVSMHVKFLTDEQTFRYVYRVDGQPIWHTALTPFKGSNTMSPFVTLAARP